MSNENLLSLRIKELRTSLNLTQKEFAELINVSTVSVSSYETETKSPSLDMVINIATKFNVSIDWLCGLSNKKNSIDNFSTYYDVLETLAKLCSVKYTDSDKPLISIDFITNLASCNQVARLTIEGDSVISTFLKNWKKMYTLLEENVINEDIYTQWLNGQLNEYKNHEINGVLF